MKRLLILSLLAGQLAAAQDTAHIIPRPVSIQYTKGSFTLSRNTVIAAQDEQDRRTAALLNEYLQQVYGFKLDIDRQETKNYIRLSTRKFIKAPDKDAYAMQVSKDGVTIEGDTYAGTFYGMQTLLQLLPVSSAVNAKQFSIPFVTVQDHPRFAYRGMHLDAGRHFFPPAFVKKYIDYLALHKMNFFHWHLTEDQGWRIEIKKYPALTQTGAFRNGTIVGRYPGTMNDNTRYGGFYTQEEIRDIVRYATERHITVVPEIEMPGHSSAAIASYPFLSCFPEEPTMIFANPSQRSQELQRNGVKKVVQETWGVHEDVYCAGKDSTFQFLQDVMDEVLTLFPSTYIHVGGDESPKNNWKRCPSCQARIKSLGLKDEHELQSYFIQRMEKYLNGKGRVLIGWDEILEGGLAPNAIVMSWRGEKGGITAATQNHQVIMTPSSPVYFDHTQTRNEDSIVIGGYNSLEAVYAYEPIPRELPADKARYVWGGQANVWTEYMRYPSKVEYMIFPRMSALSEVLWSPKESRNWSSFEKRLQTQFRRYELWKAGYSKAYYDVKVSLLPDPNTKGILVMAEPRDKTGQVTYSINGKTANRYSKPVLISQTGDVLVSYTKEGKVVNQVPLRFSFNKATGKKASIAKTPNGKYPGQGGALSLVNGIYSNKGLSHPDWLGWIGDDIEAVIDLGTPTVIDSVRLHTLDQNGSWVYLPQYVEVLGSPDGKSFTSMGRASSFVKDTLTMGWINVPIQKKKTRYIKVLAKNYGIIPEGKPGGGTRSWIFTDEIQVY